jgi:hypothetical protein
VPGCTTPSSLDKSAIYTEVLPMFALGEGDALKLAARKLTVVKDRRGSDSGLIAARCPFRSLFAPIQRSGTLPFVEPAVR